MSAPATIGHYVVQRELGRGAMGVVYLAEDTKLGRKVAIKALPAEIAQDPFRQMKFEREARTLAAVNHPNIGAIYGIEEAGGARYLVLELVDGETLAERLAFAAPIAELGGVAALPVEDALDVCRQVAAGMAAAHEQGIIHRDLKPANIKIRPDGVVKVLDFGIARGGPVEMSSQPANPDQATVVGAPPSASTHMGSIIGTPGYMSPEQARGKPVGKASDLWSFGCMIFECLTGRIAFPGETLADALAATLTLEPDWKLLPSRTPSRTITLMRRCLEKDQRQRLSEFSEAKAELERSLVDLKSPQTIVGMAVPAAFLEEEEETGWENTKGNLPTEETPFVDRPGEVAELAKLIAGNRHVSVVGVPGIGKTRLALRAALACAGSFKCGAWWADAKPVADRSVVGLELALAIGATREGDESAAHSVARRIGNHPVLVVVDSAQNAAAACAELVSVVLDSCPRATVVTVGREALGLRREAVYRTPPMNIPAEVGAIADATGAAALFRDRTRIARASLEAEPQYLPALGAMCRQLQGIPLPIELVAACAETATLEDITTKLSDRVKTLGIARLDAQPADQVVRVVVDWAYQQVTEGERGMMRRMSVFAGGCTVRSAAAVSGAADSFPDPQSSDPSGGPVTQQEARVMDMLARLASLSLVWVKRDRDGAPGNTRYGLHEPLRTLARDRLMEFTGAVSVVKRHAQYYQMFAEQVGPRLGGSDSAAWEARGLAELANVIAAAENLETLSDAAGGTRLREFAAKLVGRRGL